MKNLYPFVCSLFFSVLVIFNLYGADLAIVDFADEWTKVTGLRDTLDEFKIEYDDYTKEIENGKLAFTRQNKVFFIGSMVTNNAKLHQGLDNNAGVIQEFVKKGGLVMEPTQADQNEDNVDWLPEGLICVRTDTDLPVFKIKKPKHPLFQAPHRLTDKDFEKWGHQNWPTVWEMIKSHKGFTVIAESTGGPAIMEAVYGKGKFIMMCIAPDKYHVAGNDDNTRKKARMFMENMLEAFVLSKPWIIDSRTKLTTKWSILKTTR
ncbi:hypothetical protein CMK18_11245 [Candidatus Poribacteria bacterium]|nr:hypothetical protein [Candidatus Poribacteria bacterium]